MTNSVCIWENKESRNVSQLFSVHAGQLTTVKNEKFSCMCGVQALNKTPRRLYFTFVSLLEG